MPQTPFLTAQWHWVVMLNFEVDPELLRARVPRGTELDNWQGHTFISLVGFRFVDTRVLGFPIPFHRNFDEVNLRFYVRREDEDGLKRGVVFVREIVPRPAIAWAARAIYNEKYVALPMHHRIDISGSTKQVEYGWRLHRQRWNRMKVIAQGEATKPPEGSLEQFISEHYWGYTAQRDGGTIEYRVEHSQWPLLTAAESAVEGNFVELYGPELGGVLRQIPVSVFLAEGSYARVFRGRRIA